MRKVFTGLAVLLLLVIVAEFFFAAAGAFSADSYRPHHLLGYVSFLLPIAMIIVAVPARIPGRLIGLAALVAGLVSVQVLIAVLAAGIGDGTTAGSLVFGLHAVNALVILAVAGLIVERSLRPAGARQAHLAEASH
ncbi:DUF6220 domain-containing protein [Actinoplanes aureus]|uniref:Uncharacterized protein n=1 Tax=Actinoplanes aureus TaxID=2792083 RepID=A0A931CBL2_9ACTN|nr:DUF6220 domain-containing protein [Actinoplanes aureus]MBG0564397.1 hypothetical protein [Actinoplanes aureus]